MSALFSSFVGAVTGRSLLCCEERMHFGAMYSQKFSHRDIPMNNEQVLQVLMQTAEIDAEHQGCRATALESA